MRNWCQLRKGSPRSTQRQTGRALERAAGMVKDVLCWETPGESYAEALGLSSIVDCWDKSLWQLGAKPELQNMPLLPTAQHSTETGPWGCVWMTVASEVNEKRERLKERSWVKINSWDLWIHVLLYTCCIHCFIMDSYVHLEWRCLNGSLTFEKHSSA